VRSVVELTSQYAIDKDSPIPYYFQVEQILESNIRSGRWRPEERIPTEEELCRLFMVSRSVIRQALKDLEIRGLVWRAPGKGTFVARPKVQESLIQTLSGFYEDAVAQGRRPTSRILEQKVIPATAELAQLLQLDVGDPVIFINRVRLLDGEPHILSLTHVPFERCPGLVHEDLTKRSLYATLEGKYGLHITHGRRIVEAVIATDEEAALLEIKPGAPLILLRSLSYLADGAPIEYDIGKHRGDRTRFEVELVRQPR